MAYEAPGAVTDSSTAASSLPSQWVLAAKVSDTAPSVRYWLYMVLVIFWDGLNETTTLSVPPPCGRASKVLLDTNFMPSWLSASARLFMPISTTLSLVRRAVVLTCAFTSAPILAESSTAGICKR